MSVSFVWSDDNLVKLIAQHLAPRDVFSLSHTNSLNRKAVPKAFSGFLNERRWNIKVTKFWEIRESKISQELLDFVLIESGHHYFHIAHCLAEKALFRMDAEYISSLFDRGVLSVSSTGELRTKERGIHLCQCLFKDSKEMKEELVRRGVFINKFCADCC
ncbi:hypothetical protein ISTM_306 [Insectomime virus]|uniref:F-box domain-containing protein n=1 Tax=Tunisvirus fontaine2 TaxID=1421067 RepID=V9SEJ4_9VIRU|nr:hypothetical protein D1R32_gp009 [Tunisvirus fontaine2]AHA46204.1 hypothetical protein ISTM_306 [Insectomime virus]AHC54726.1 hypothetical protein TNS_ORF8 [Tunisvirus fontaine2]